MLPVAERTSGPMSNQPDWKTRSEASGGGDFWLNRAKVAASEMICMRKDDVTVLSSSEPSERRWQVGVLLHLAPSVKLETYVRRQLPLFFASASFKAWTSIIPFFFLWHAAQLSRCQWRGGWSKRFAKAHICTERKPWFLPLLRPPLKKAEGDQKPTAVRTARRLLHHMVSLSFSSHLITVCRSARPQGVTLNKFKVLFNNERGIWNSFCFRK